MSSASRFPPSFTFLPNFIRESPCVKRRVRHKTWNRGPLITVWLSGVMSRSKIENDNREIYQRPPLLFNSTFSPENSWKSLDNVTYLITSQFRPKLQKKKKRIEVPTPKENKRQEGGANLICWTCNHATSRRGIEEMCVNTIMGLTFNLEEGNSNFPSNHSVYQNKNPATFS